MSQATETMTNPFDAKVTAIFSAMADFNAAYTHFSLDAAGVPKLLACFCGDAGMSPVLKDAWEALTDSDCSKEDRRAALASVLDRLDAMDDAVAVAE